MDPLPLIRFAGAGPRIVALHGFTQRGASLAEVAGLLAREVLAADLPGHGTVPAVRFEVAIEAVAATLERPSVVVGYSQGGRLALGLSLEHPELVSGLVLISAGIGIADPRARDERRRRDVALADRIEVVGLDVFLDEWMTRFPGLATRGAAWLAADRAVRSTNRVEGLAGALRLMGQGAQPSYELRLGDLKVPTLYIAGGEDARYAAIGRVVAAEAPTGKLAIIEGAGHAVVGERPGDVARLVDSWIRHVLT